MYAVVRSGGKQYRVAQGDVVAVEKLLGKAGDTVSLNEVLAIGGDKAQVGSPLIAGAVVSAEIIKQSRTDKVIIFKKKRRQNYRRKGTHRQHETVLRITALPGQTPGSTPAKKEAKAPKADAAPKAAAKPKAPAKAAADKKPAAKKAAPKKTTKE